MGQLEQLAADQGLQYEIGDGTLLGGVKVANYMPWDIDIDVDYNRKQLYKYKPGGAFQVALKKAGIDVQVGKYIKSTILLLLLPTYNLAQDIMR